MYLPNQLDLLKPGLLMSKTGDLNAAPSKSARGGCFKRAARKMNCAVLLMIFTVLVDRMPAAYAEESSILANAQVTETYLEYT